MRYTPSCPAGANRIVPSGLHVPLELTPAIGKSHKATLGPPLISTLRSLPPARNAIDLLSGDQKELTAPVVSVNWRGTEESMGLTHKDSLPSFPNARNPRYLPSGDTATATSMANDNVSAGAGTMNSTVDVSG